MTEEELETTEAEEVDLLSTLLELVVYINVVEQRFKG